MVKQAAKKRPVEHEERQIQPFPQFHLEGLDTQQVYLKGFWNVVVNFGAKYNTTSD